MVVELEGMESSQVGIATRHDCAFKTLNCEVWETALAGRKQHWRLVTFFFNKNVLFWNNFGFIVRIINLVQRSPIKLSLPFPSARMFYNYGTFMKTKKLTLV